MPNQVSLTFAGDASKLAAAAKDAEKATAGVGDAALEASKDLERAGASSDDAASKLAKVGSAAGGISTAIDDAAGSFQALADAQDAERAQAVKIERALNDVAQAQADYTQALGDGRQASQDATQAGIDYEQAQVDARVALEDHAAAVAEFGAGSAEAAQAQVDLKQANADATQAQLDQEQALRDGTQAAIDAKGATLDLSDANAEANPGQFQAWADQLAIYTPLLSGIVGILGLVAAAQVVWNLAMAASPLVWIVAAIAAVIAVIVLIATQTEWFQELWEIAWGAIQAAAENVWNWLKQVPGWIEGAFKSVGDSITAPFKAAFNGIADLWNNTIGSLSWTVPDWVPVIGGGTITVPKIPKFHTGGTVEGVPGQEVLAMLQAGETVTPAGGGRGGGTEVRFVGNTSDALATVIMGLVRTGRIQLTAAA
jgi:hypothetical protein